jgi:hypothetical protein
LEMSAIESNEAERRRWNDCAWAAALPKRERLTTTVTDVLFGRARLRLGYDPRFGRDRRP